MDWMGGIEAEGLDIVEGEVLPYLGRVLEKSTLWGLAV